MKFRGKVVPCSCRRLRGGGDSCIVLCLGSRGDTQPWVVGCGVGKKAQGVCGSPVVLSAVA